VNNPPAAGRLKINDERMRRNVLAILVLVIPIYYLYYLNVKLTIKKLNCEEENEKRYDNQPRD
jgi:hypothetical protein